MERHLSQELAHQMMQYRDERRRFWLREFPPAAAICLLIIFAVVRLAEMLLGPVTPGGFMLIAAIAFTVLVLPACILAPSKPTYALVKRAYFVGAKLGYSDRYR